jgi:arylsulfatase A-like enzyme
LHTGLYPHTTGVMRVTPGQRLDDSFETLAELFRAAGYLTAAYVSSPALNASVNLTQGFEEYVETYRRAAAFKQTRAGASGWLRLHQEGRFFLWVHFNNAHVPYLPPADLHGMFVDDDYYDASRKVAINTERNDLPVEADHPFVMQITRGDLGGVYPGFVLQGRPSDRPRERDYYIAEYDAAIRDADRLIGGLLSTLEELGLAERTIVAVVGDHGESLGEHDYFFEHGRLPYDACQRVPLIVGGAVGVKPGRRVSGPVGLIDLAPTLLELAGLAVPPALEGKSLVPVMRRGESRGDVYFSAGYQLDFMTGVRRGRWKLIKIPNEMDRSIAGGTEYELYDVVADTGELHNLYAAEPVVADELRRSLETWLSPWWSKAITTTTAEKPESLDEPTKRQMRSLGYAGSEADGEAQ